MTDLVDVNAALEQKFTHGVMAVFDGEDQKTCFPVEGVVEEGVVVLEKRGDSGDVPGTGGLDEPFSPRGVYG